MKTYKITFTDFWQDFDGQFFKWIIEKAGYKVEIVSGFDNPDLLFYSVFGKSHLRYNCKKVFWTGENVRPNMESGDFALSFDFLDHPNHYRFPLYAYQRWIWAREGLNWGNMDLSIDQIFDTKIWSKDELYKKKPNFCVFLQGNPGNIFRNEFFQRLNSVKRVDSAGSLFNNTGFVVGWREKLQFMKDYRFCIAFENSSHNGYTTEKIFEPMLVKTIPVYWGSDSAKIEFNEKSYVDVNGLSIESAVEKVLSYENDTDLYYEMWKEPFLKSETEWSDLNNLVNFFKDKVL